ncbi:MAG: methionyl-tRNA formyltransferase [Chitinophagales bacterium]
MRIVFMGTPEFAVPCLDILYKNGFTIAGVITAPDKKSGRGQKLQTSAVKKYALEKDFNILQPTNLKDSEFINTLRALKADLQVVVAFRMLPEIVWAMPSKGTFNLHASLLPDYRGAAPINWAIINGEKITGVTSFFIEKEIDTGKILFQEKVTIAENDTAGTLHNKLMDKGAEVVLKTVQAIDQNYYKAIEQDQSKALHQAPKIFPADCKINFDQAAKQVYNFIRGLSPYPGAWCYLDGNIFKIYFAEITEEKTQSIQAGTVEKSRKQLKIACKDYWLSLKEVQPEKKRRMDIKSFLAGYQELQPKIS